ncbi:GntR family transcriptional regulator [Shouchella patagoniensis]|uniref:GntR family transcriptional regulator n=1 Tax=Shouchella patagoniensis TaxID=228576 RepID=UPI000994C762|nr:GntR family transcriptional regulator [Shouchella patagoniensis]
MKLNRKNGPLYTQIKNILKERILSQVYPVRSLIPPESQLELEFGVSKITVRKAVEQLASEGYVDKRSGIGTTVLDNAAIINMSTGQNFSSHLLQAGKQLSKEVLSISQQTAPPDSLKHICSIKAYTLIERLYYLDQKPYIYMVHYIPNTIALSLEPGIYERSLYNALQESGVSFNRFRDEFHVAAPPMAVSKLLLIEQKPLLVRTRSAYDLHESLIEYSIAYYLTDLHSYVINFNV